MHPLFSQAARITHDVIESDRMIDKAQLLSYMKLLDVPLALVVNFHALKLTAFLG